LLGFRQSDVFGSKKLQQFSRSNAVDDYMTPKYVWKFLQPFIPKGKTISDPFTGDGWSARHLRSLGFLVKDHEGQDFFNLGREDLADAVVSNPPFSKKKEVLRRLKELDVPFMLILPLFVLSTKYLRDLFGSEIKLIIPPRRLHFRKLGEEEAFGTCSFETAFFCWKIELKESITYLEHQDDGDDEEVQRRKHTFVGGRKIATFTESARVHSVDEYMTPFEVWEQIEPFIPRCKIISDPFYGDGMSARYLRQMGFLVKDHEGDDFFDLAPEDFGDVIITNLPFSKKQQCFRRLEELDIPFITIAPWSSVVSKYIRELFGDSMQYLIPRKRLHFRKRDDEEVSKQCSFETVFYCWKIPNLPNQMNYIEDLLEKK